MKKTEASPSSAPPSTEVTEKATRRQFSGKDKLRILKLADACTEPGQLGAMLRREGLYSSHLVAWRKARTQGGRAALTPQKRGRKPAVVDVAQARVAPLERQLAKTTARAERAEAMVALQKKSPS